ncbi:hypothetical protein KQX54_015709 [Cotesia glomerata]|uniref:Uncharacterized protein n=1 Tax=Cotesia glomerata TaxID=32391 RepID=A0AAV7HVW6_COTGL|nr:hypothetical protein KQX54_015709 [Cotesia glomerata]
MYAYAYAYDTGLCIFKERPLLADRWSLTEVIAPKSRCLYQHARTKGRGGPRAGCLRGRCSPQTTSCHQPRASLRVIVAKLVPVGTKSPDPQIRMKQEYEFYLRMKDFVCQP